MDSCPDTDINSIFLLSYGKVCTVYLILLTSVHLFVCFPNNLNYCCQQMQEAHKMCTVINTLISE